MSRTALRLLAALILTAVLSGCVILAPKIKPLPPGQVKHLTGVNPASGKVKHR